MKTPIELCRGIGAQPESNLFVRFYEIRGFSQTETHQEPPARRFAVSGGWAARIILIAAVCGLFVLGGPAPVWAAQLSTSVVAWGWNASGQTNVPSGLSGVVAIAAGNTHNLALKSDR